MIADYTRDSQAAPNSSLQGFSLIEVLIVLALLSLLILLNLPTLSRLKEQQVHQQAASQLEQLIKLGREQALYQQSTITLCPTTNQVNCQTNWQFPLILFLDQNQNNQRDHDEPVIATFTLPHAIQLIWNRGNHLSFYGASGIAASNGTLSFCTPHISRQFILNRQGRLRQTTQPCTF
ncbi:GspH/FimT family protein [Piscirickettsia salmonis]|uniref:GspH/FimT family protein n=1 Tax=Piscirickettsia salmonis TaxID=1238 RepID=UPI0007C8BFD3|nr:hypothetical protein A0O36_01034 [Piscirickettsiaceae bacterium NZ-RLO1]